MLVAYTDGLIESRSASGAPFGIDRVRELIEAHASAGPEAVHSAVMRTAIAWAPAQHDDITFIVARYAPEKP